MVEPKTQLTDAARALVSRERKLYEYDVGHLFGVEALVIKVRVPTKREQDLALAGAHGYVSQLADKSPHLKDDQEILFDSKAAFIVATACRDGADPLKFPAWPTGGFVHEQMTADQIGSLLHIVNEVRSKDGPVKTELTDEQVEAFATMCAINGTSSQPETVLTPLPHYYLVQLYILTAMKLAEARRGQKRQLGDDEASGGDEAQASEPVGSNEDGG